MTTHTDTHIGYLPIFCPCCGRRRVEGTLRTTEDGRQFVVAVKCEKCGMDEDWDHPDANQSMKVGDRLRRLGDTAKDAVDEALLIAGDHSHRGVSRIRSFETNMAAAEVMIDKALEEIGPDPHTTDQDTTP